MKAFNTYLNLNKQGDVYIKLTDNAFLYIGREGVFPGELGKFFLASEKESDSNHFFVVTKSWGRFESNPKAEKVDFKIPAELQAAIIRRIFGSLK